ncbi:hypothetical protein DFO69_1020 [Bacillus subtilis]|nr:hypothetical protein DFO69_1020 [Bacillus subtilis]
MLPWEDASQGIFSNPKDPINLVVYHFFNLKKYEVLTLSCRL